MDKNNPIYIIREMSKQSSIHHSIFEDLIAITTGTILVSLGIVLFEHVGALTGSTAGISFLLNYTLPISFGLAFFLVNLPFYLFAFLKMGWVFTLKTFITVSLVSFFTHIHPMFLNIVEVNLIYATLIGNLLIGTGFVVLFRHGTSIGGITILALYIQDKFGFRAGYFQMMVDVVVVSAAFFIVELPALLVSIVGAIVLNLIIALNHRKDRYVAY